MKVLYSTFCDQRPYSNQWGFELVIFTIYKFLGTIICFDDVLRIEREGDEPIKVIR